MTTTQGRSDRRSTSACAICGSYRAPAPCRRRCAPDRSATERAGAPAESTGSCSRSACWRRSPSRRRPVRVQRPTPVARPRFPCRQRSASEVGPRDWPMTRRPTRSTRPTRTPTPSRWLPPSRAMRAIRRDAHSASARWHSGQVPFPKVSLSIHRRTRSTWPTRERHDLGRQHKNLQCIRSEWLRADATNRRGPGRAGDGHRREPTDRHHLCRQRRQPLPVDRRSHRLGHRRGHLQRHHHVGMRPGPAHRDRRVPRPSPSPSIR